MVKLPRLTCQEAEDLWLQAGFRLVRTEDSEAINQMVRCNGRVLIALV